MEILQKVAVKKDVTKNLTFLVMIFQPSPAERAKRDVYLDRCCNSLITLSHTNQIEFSSASFPMIFFICLWCEQYCRLAKNAHPYTPIGFDSPIIKNCYKLKRQKRKSSPPSFSNGRHVIKHGPTNHFVVIAALS